MKRFVETEKWNDPWFRRLTPEHKLLWDYLYTRCDNCGVWVVDWELAAFHIGITYQERDALSVLGDRVRDIGRGRWWIPKFIEFQFGTLVANSRVHQSILTLMRKHGIYTLWIGYRKAIDRAQEKDKDTDKDKDKDKDGKGPGENQSSGGMPSGGMPGLSGEMPPRSSSSDQMSTLSASGEMPPLDQVKAAVMTSGIPDQFVELVYHSWKTRGRKDAAGLPVEIVDYVKKRWFCESADWLNGTHRAQQKGAHGTGRQSGKPGLNRNQGTRNDPTRYSAENLRKLPNYHGADGVSNAKPGT